MWPAAATAAGPEVRRVAAACARRPRVGRDGAGSGGGSRWALWSPLSSSSDTSAAHATLPPFNLSTAHVTNSFVDALPADPIQDNTPRQVLGALYTRVSPTPPPGPIKVVAYSDALAHQLGVPALTSALGLGGMPDSARQEWLEVLGGARDIAGSKPYAQCYGGHQFGSWAGQLGDGRAVSLCEVTPLASAGAGIAQRQELQLKGAGRTPYSRFADGRAVLRSSVREFLGSEAMAALGVPTTRALSLVATGDGVVRDQFYDGNRQAEPGAVVCRVAPSFLRFGSWELPYSREDKALLEATTDYALRNHFPDLWFGGGDGDAGDADDAVTRERRSEAVAAMYARVVASSARLVAHWQAVGFTHGVLNTDNMSVLGLTIDYGPYGFLEAYVPDGAYVPNTSDRSGRYAYRNQPAAARWNCMRFGMALSPMVPVEKLNDVLATFDAAFDAASTEWLARKLGFAATEPGAALSDGAWRGDGDMELANDFFALMEADRTDFTATWRMLSSLPSLHPDGSGGESDGDVALDAALRRELPRLGVTSEGRVAAWREWAQRYGRRLGNASRAGSAGHGVAADVARKVHQNRANPSFVLRNWQMHAACVAAENGDFGEVRRLAAMAQRPFVAEDDVGADELFAAATPEADRHADAGVGDHDGDGASALTLRHRAWSRVLKRTVPAEAYALSEAELDMVQWLRSLDAAGLVDPSCAPVWSSRAGVSVNS